MSVPPETVEPYPGWAQENKGPTILAVSGTLTGIAFFAVIARIYCRIISLRQLRIDDYIVILSIALGLAYVVLTAISVSYGIGKHIAVLPPADVPYAIEFMLISLEPGISSFVVPKFAVVILLFNILHPGRWHRIVLWLISVLLFLLCAAMLIINVVRCSPPSAAWGAAEGRCWDLKYTNHYAVGFSSFSAAVDFYLAIYPTFVLSRLMLSWKKKLALSSALGFGYCAGAVATYKCYALAVPSLLMEDVTFQIDTVVLWTSIEGNCVLIGACIPCLYPLVKKLFGTSALSSDASARHGSQQKQSGLVKSLLTIGARPKRQTPRRDSLSLSAIDAMHHEGSQISLRRLAGNNSAREFGGSEGCTQQHRDEEEDFRCVSARKMDTEESCRIEDIGVAL